MHVQNIHTMDELKMTGNCLKGSRGIVSFDKAFDETEWGRLTKEVFTHVSIISYLPVSSMRGTDVLTRYSAYLRVQGERNLSSTISLLSPSSTTKYGSVTSKCVSAVFHIGLILLMLSNLCLYHPQILEKDPLQPNGPSQTTLVEIGPRFVLTPIRIFEGAFSGATVFANPGTLINYVSLLSNRSISLFAEFVSPAVVRSAIRREKGEKYKIRKDTEMERVERREERRRDEDELAVHRIFA